MNTKLYGEIALLAGNGNPGLAREISEYLGVPLHRRSIITFANENIFVQVEQTVRSQDVFIIQPTCSPVNNNIMELLIMIDTVRRASAGRITAVIPFFAYARSDKKDMPRVPITARLLADMISTAGADRFMVVDLHAGQIQGFFSIPGDELTAYPLLCAYVASQHIPNMVVVAADLGFAKKARNFAERLDVPVAFIEKRREGGDAHSYTVIGDVRDRNVLIVDDEVDQGTTLCEGARIVRESGARDVYACFVHPTLSRNAASNLAGAGFREIICTNTEPIPPAKLLPNMRVIHLGPWLARVINAVHQGASVGETIRSYEPEFDDGSGCCRP